MTWTFMKQKFGVEGDRVVRATWDKDEGWTKIHLERK